MANKKVRFDTSTPKKTKRGRPPKNSTPLNIELTDRYPDEKDRAYYRKRFDQFMYDYPDLNASSDMTVLDALIDMELRKTKVIKMMNDPEHTERLIDKEYGERIEKIEVSMNALLKTLKVQRADRDTTGKDDTLSLIEFAARYDNKHQQERTDSNREEELELLKRKALKAKPTEDTEKPAEKKSIEGGEEPEKIIAKDEVSGIPGEIEKPTVGKQEEGNV